MLEQKLDTKALIQYVMDMEMLQGVCLDLEEEPLEGRGGITAHVSDSEVGQTVDQEQREASYGLESLTTHEQRVLCFLKNKSAVDTHQSATLNNTLQLSVHSLQRRPDAYFSDESANQKQITLCTYSHTGLGVMDNM